MARNGQRWEDLSTKRLLRVRICDLGLRLDDSPLQDRIQKVLGELKTRRLRLRPHFWLSDEWACPDGVPGVSIPFYLAHPRLISLERTQMSEVEGGTIGECHRLLRHEIGHAFQNAYRLHRRRQWRDMFGASSRPYPDYYQPDPTSKSYVVHLSGWYAQCHPSEDFAETFAVWLRPGHNWRRRYAGWPAKRKLEYVDSLMKAIAGKPAPVRRRTKPYSLSRLTQTLGDFYEEKRARYQVTSLPEYDEDLHRVFTNGARSLQRPTAADFLRRNRRALIDDVVRFAPDYGPIVDHVIDEMQLRSRELGLRIRGRESALLRDVSLILMKRAIDLASGPRRWWPV